MRVQALKKEPEKSKRSLNINDEIIDGFIEDWNKISEEYNNTSLFDIQKEMKDGTVQNLTYKRFNENEQNENKNDVKEENIEVKELNQNSNIMKYHKLLMETSENKEDYLRQFMAENQHFQDVSAPKQETQNSI